MATTKIDWCDTVWNQVTGCLPVSAGYDNCYASRMAKRLAGRCGYPADDPFKVTFHPDKLELPMTWKKSRRIFVNSMGYLFHEDVEFSAIDQIMAYIALCPQHTFMVLTKRPEIMKKYFLTKDRDERIGWQAHNICENTKHELDYSIANALIHGPGKVSNLPDNIAPPHPNLWPLPNLWLGVSVENQETADERIPILLDTPAAHRLISCEPLLGVLNLRNYLALFKCGAWGCHAMLFENELVYHYKDDDDYDDQEIGVPKCPYCDSDAFTTSDSYPDDTIDWLVCGGETGPNARPCHPDWVRGLRDQCQAAQVPFFFKSWGEWVVGDQDPLEIIRVGKKKVGRLIDGREWRELPEGV